MKKLVTYSGVAAAVVFSAFLALAIYNYSSYNILSTYLSDLGVGVFSAQFFNTGCIITGIIGLAFSYSVYKKFKTKVAGLALFVISISLMGIGVFTESYGVLHTAFSGLFFIATALTIILVGLEHFKGIVRYYSILTGAFCLLFITFRLPLFEHIAAFAIILWVLVFSLLSRK